ncbi:hypothetical protein [Rhodopirellula sp. MGV]|uniref:hypothetical protein n=1 Tax=Rhodopirellula sp. MGV TaxID=2023130 RepID=UPI000B97AF62|nr:hypothetical protein [Rhodopirellula sp. MGV]OYP31654.1 hypothetical protein CGZ80_20805 [Rhodopirellula sp. MGV]PNY36811.1 hypothetical protein C2E31_11055 [Rhodopirellula baltica]
MAYGILLYVSSVKHDVLVGAELDELVIPPLGLSVTDDLKLRLPVYGYSIESETPVCTEYIHKNAKWAIQIAVFKTEIAFIQIAVFKTEIAFSIPYWEESEIAIENALETAYEIADSLDLVVYDQQTGDWSE